MFLLNWIEVEEENTERELEQKPKVEERKSENTRRERRGDSEEVVNLVIGRELEVHEFGAERETAAQSFTGTRLLEAGKKRSMKFGDTSSSYGFPFLSGNLV